MDFAFATVGMMEVLVLIASAVSLITLVLRSLYRTLFVPHRELPKGNPEDLRQLKRAGEGARG